MVGEIHDLGVLALVEERQRRHGVVAEGAVVVERRLPVEGRVVVVLHDSRRDGVRIALVHVVALRGQHPRIALAES